MLPRRRSTVTIVCVCYFYIFFWVFRKGMVEFFEGAVSCYHLQHSVASTHPVWKTRDRRATAQAPEPKTKQLFSLTPHILISLYASLSQGHNGLSDKMLGVQTGRVMATAWLRSEFITNPWRKLQNPLKPNLFFCFFEGLVFLISSFSRSLRSRRNWRCGWSTFCSYRRILFGCK